MNKKQAIAYAKVTLNYMQSSKYSREINPKTLGVEMRQAFKLYSRDIIQNIADSQIYADKQLEDIKSGCDRNGK